MFNKFIKLTLIIIFIFFTTNAYASQQINHGFQVTVKIKPEVNRVGDILSYQVKVNHDPKFKIIEAKPDLNPFYIHQYQVFKKKNGVLYQIRISSFQLGEQVIPSWNIAYILGKEKGIILIPQIKIKIASVLTSNDNLRLKPLKSVFDFKWFIIILLAIILGIILIIFSGIFRKRNTFLPAVNSDLIIESNFFREISALEALDVSQKENVDLFCVQISRIIREFLSYQYKKQLTNLTSDEILRELELYLTESKLESLKKILDFLDLVKFAKYNLTNQMKSDFLKQVKTVIF